jgi:hypothetical protein
MLGMMKRFSILAAILVAVAPVPALADASSFTLVNATAANMTSVQIRRSGTESWKPLGVAPAAGTRGAVPFSDPDCAFDIEAALAGGGTAVWSGVNLCEAKIVTLNRNDSGAVWVDYD